MPAIGEILRAGVFPGPGASVLGPPFPVGVITLANGPNGDIVLPPRAVYVQASGPSGAYTVSGFAGGVDGRLLLIHFNVGQALTLSHTNAGSQLINRLWMESSADFVSAARPTFAAFIYDAASTIWREMFHTN